jgi:sugar phosphate isomerase/epimerase
MEQWFKTLGRYLVEVHLHDNDGTADSHWAVEQGTFDFEEFFMLMNEHAPIPVFTIEARDHADVETSLVRVKRLMIKDR